MQNGDDAKDDFENDEWETLATVVDKILAWEKKLYDEVKVHLIPFFFFNSWPMNFYILDWFYGSSIMLPLKLKWLLRLCFSNLFERGEKLDVQKISHLLQSTAITY